MLEGLREVDYPYTFCECSTAEELLTKIGKGCWPIRQGFIYGSLAFINQVNQGDEWWALKKYPDNTIERFESLPMERKISVGKDWGNRDLADVIRELDRAETLEELYSVWL